MQNAITAWHNLHSTYITMQFLIASLPIGNCCCFLLAAKETIHDISSGIFMLKKQTGNMIQNSITHVLTPASTSLPLPAPPLLSLFLPCHSYNQPLWIAIRFQLNITHFNVLFLLNREEIDKQYLHCIVSMSSWLPATQISVKHTLTQLSRCWLVTMSPKFYLIALPASSLIAGAHGYL